MENNETTSSSGENPKPWQSYHTVYTNAKAGMEEVDKEKVQRIVYEMSKGSKYFENEERKEAYMRQKIEKMRVQCAKLTAADISHYQLIADKRILELEGMRDLSRIWLHVDMDAFYAAVETLSNPSLKGKPMAVGSMSMISTANYEARRFGVCAAMPGFIARKLCPQLIFVPTDFKKYTHYSDLTRKVFQKYDPRFTAASLDEAYLDITDVCKERGIAGGEIAEELRTAVHEETGLTCSAGVAPNRLLAKVCSDINKPNGQFVLPNDRMAVMTFISSLPIRKIGGIGKVTEHVLKEVLGINTCVDMLQKCGLLCALFSRSSADFFLSVGLGLGGTNTPQVKFRKSISSERTFSATDDEALLYQKLADIAEMLCTDMEKEGLRGRTLTLKLKTASFENWEQACVGLEGWRRSNCYRFKQSTAKSWTWKKRVRTRAVTLQKYICSSEDILKYASKLLKAELPISLRLMGLRVSHFNEDKVGTPSDPTQKTLTDFIVSGDASRKNMSSDCSDQHFMGDIEEAFSTGSHDIHHNEIRNPLDSNNVEDLDDRHFTISNNGEAEEVHESLSSDGNTVDTGRFDSECCHTELSELKDAESSLPQQVDGGSPDIVNKAVIMDNAAVFWVDNYKCSLCGIQMPPDFIEERQEHSDFHLAERLQKEESSINSRTPMRRQRLVSKKTTDVSGRSSCKKHKPSPLKDNHLSIDMFFVKSNQKF
ncbi:DNA polymerase kappa isoform X2 [Jatropha curcas]|uniref:DNA polymerase kappa isoform X2 n=1 Tax=Jatropha curcas TaxID=180498 RepID=UPI0005FADC36|nr:DNA polymerase kappa isoform X2 [Jatropha curcas]